jgi:hypothetical protein
LREIFRREEAAVLGKGELDAMLGTGLGENEFNGTGLAILSFDDGVLEVRGFRKEEDFLDRRLGRLVRSSGDQQAKAKRGGIKDYFSDEHG